jgi:hypothetical protein
VGQPARIDDDRVDAFLAGGMDAVDQRTFMVALKARKRRARSCGLGLGSAFDVGQRLPRRTPQARGSPINSGWDR